MAENSRIIKACLYALKNNLALKPGEKTLVVTDVNKRKIGEAFTNSARQITANVELTEIPVAEFNGQEPPAEAANKMLTADVVLMPVTTSLSWTQARMDATETGARIGSMAGGLDEDIILRTFETNYFQIKERANKICDLLDTTDEVLIQTELGTDLRIGIAGRQGRGRKGGLYTEKGNWGNIPCGEAFIAPVEGSTNGVYFVDASQAGVGKVKQPIQITVKDGFATEFAGGEDAAKLQAKLDSVGDPKAYNIGELGIGCNDKAQLSGATIEDEKVLGTCHIALGNNHLFGGKTKVGIHVDGIIKSPSIWFDSKKIMEQGKLLI